MTTAYEHLKIVFRALTRIDDAFYSASKQLRDLTETECSDSWSLFGDYVVPAKNETVTQWERQITADRRGTKVRWHLVIQLAHSAMSCEITAVTGFDPEEMHLHSIDSREIGPASINILDSLPPKLDEILEELFSDLEGDCAAAVRSRRKQMEPAQTNRSNTDSEQGAAPNP
tara:strand:+ start:386 stop:901 length:516 start_codon:yes stop_codon:yes gene_type:complete